MATTESSQDLKPQLQSLHIQMEYCEKSTLRNVIDEGLYKNQRRIWRLLREIVEGLVHVHSQVSLIGTWLILVYEQLKLAKQMAFYF